LAYIQPALRAYALLPFVVDSTPYHLVRVVLSSIGIMCAVWSLACACEMNVRRQRRVFYGLTLGLLLMMCVRLGWYSIDPITMLPLNIPGAVLAAGAAVAIMVLDIQRERLDASLPTVDENHVVVPVERGVIRVEPVSAAPKELELPSMSALAADAPKDTDRPPAVETRRGRSHRSEALGWGEWLIWVPDAFALGSVIYLSLFFCTSSSLLPRYAGYEVFPMELVTIFTFALGIIAVPAFRNAGLWWGAAIIGAGLVGYIAEAGAFIGGCVAISLPTQWFVCSRSSAGC
jgi:hypothetical protein